MENNIAQRYEQAQEIMQGMMTTKLVKNTAVFPHWIASTDTTDDECFWYRRDTVQGKDFRLVNAHTGDNTPAFDHQALAVALTKASGETINPRDLPLTTISIDLSLSQLRFQSGGQSWLYDIDNNVCTEMDPLTMGDALISPDGKKTIFVRDYNLWIRDLLTGKEQALTQDGTADNAYGHAPWSLKIQGLWSPDSQRFFTHQLDLRQVTNRILVDHIPEHGTPDKNSLRPTLLEQKMAYPCDEHVESYRFIAIEVNTEKVQEANYDLVPFFCMGEGFFTEEKLGWWASDSQRAFFVDVARGAKTVRVVEFNTQTGATRVLFEESSDTFVKISHSTLEFPVFRPIPESDELIWLSERSGWAHLYLYDLKTGQLKRALTGVDAPANGSNKESNEWLVRNILHVDAKRREILIQTAGKDPSINPYYRDICRLDIDSAQLTPLVSGNYDYVVYDPSDRQIGTRAAFGIDSIDVSGLSPSGNYIVTTYSRVDTAPVSVLIDRQGREILTLETADVSALPQGWQWPEPVKVKAADGQTDIYGVVYRPPNFSKEKSYPIIDFSCGHPYFSWVPQGSFINGPCLDAPYLHGLAYAALGFIVIALEGRGTPYRSKAFQDYSYGNITSASAFEDRIEGIAQLARQYPYIDVNRAGIAADDGSPVPVYGLLKHPDFYKVGVSICYEDVRYGIAALYEQYQGLLPSNNSEAEDLACALSGQLLLIHGMLDYFTPVTGTIRLLDALQNANKDFELLLMPKEGHDIPTYAIRRSWDYFVTHLQGIEPPSEFPLTTGFDVLLNDLAEAPQ